MVVPGRELARWTLFGDDRCRMQKAALLIPILLVIAGGISAQVDTSGLSEEEQARVASELAVDEA